MVCNEKVFLIDKTRLITLFLYCAPIVDIFIGISMGRTGEDALLGKIYRSAFLVVLVCVYFAAKPTKVKARNLFIFLSLAVIIYPCIHVLTNHNVNGFITDVVQGTKLVYPIVLYEASVQVSKQEGNRNIKFNSVLNFFCWFYATSVLVPYVLGIGYKAYETSNMGYRGLYSSANELSIVLVCMYIYSLYRLIMNPNLGCAINVGANFFATILTGTKVGMIMIIIGSAVVLLFMKKNPRVVKGLAFFVLFFCIGCVVFYDYAEEIVNESIRMIEFKYRQLDVDFVSFMLSLRNYRIIPQINMFYQESNCAFFNLMFGVGYAEQLKSCMPTIGYGITEMDWFDVLFQHGVVMLIIVFGFYIRALQGMIVKKNTQWIIRFLILAMLIYGTLAGHTIQFTLPSTILSVLMIINYQEYNAKNENSSSDKYVSV